jgi:hypothetical protein
MEDSPQGLERLPGFLSQLDLVAASDRKGSAISLHVPLPCVAFADGIVPTNSGQELF